MNAQRPRVLVVDDDDAVRAFSERALRDGGCDVVVASDGMQALDVIAQHPPFDLYVLDLVMPQMTGDELARHVRQTNPGARVLYFTGFSDRLFNGDPLRENEAVLEKPVTMHALLEAVLAMALRAQTTAVVNEDLVRRYYACFNERRFQDAVALFADDAHLELVSGRPESGRAGYVDFAESWTAAFLDATFSVERIEPRSETVCEVYLLATGTHQGVFDFGSYRFKPTGSATAMHLRELLEIRDGQITAAVLTFNVTDFVNELTNIDYDALAMHLDRICASRQDLAHATGQCRRELTEQLAQHLDAARRAVRPYYNR
jgi:CheY-like chemotaxis protein/ketosteroid isomerase-like protein